MILHILKKDARRLWPAILLSLVVLASLAWHDSRRSDWIAGEIEQQLSLLVPAVWALLIGLAVEQDPIAGDRQFWVTRPYRRGALLGAKLLFAALFVHLPSLVADCYIVAARGFSPTAYVGRLLVRQLTLALALTLPAMALATLVRGFKHFLLAATGVVTVALLVGEWRPAATMRWAVLETARWQSVFLLLGCAAAVVLPFSYLRRRVLISRTVAAAAGCIACLVFILFAPQSALGVRSAIAGRTATLSLRLEPRARLVAPHWAGQTTVEIPIAVDGVPEGAHVTLLPLWSEIRGKTRSYRETSYRRPNESPYWTAITSPDGVFIVPTSIVLRMSPAVFAELASGPVTIRGEAAATLYRAGQTLALRPSDSGRRADGARCRTELTQDRMGQERIKVECESPRLDPGGMRVRATAPLEALNWVSGRPFAPRQQWLFSPVDRDQSYINVSPGPRQFGPFYMPDTILPKAHVEITPYVTLGETAVQYELRDIDLRKFIGTLIGFKRAD